MPRVVLVPLVVAVVAIVATHDARRAAAEPAAPPLIEQPLVLPAGAVVVATAVEASLAPKQRFAPLSLAPDLWWGATDRLTVGVTTSSRAVSRLRAGAGFCVRDDDHGCPRTYDNLGLDARYGLIAGASAVAVRARLVWRTLEPGRPSLRLGATARWAARGWALVVDPHLAAGLALRARGNRSTVEVPAWIERAVGRHVVVALRTGVRGEIEGLGEKYVIAIGAVTRARLGDRVELGLEVGMPRIYGAQHNYGDRVAGFWLAVRVDP